MRFVSGVGNHEFWCLANNHVIHTALHRAKQVMVEVGYVDCLMQYQQQNLSGLRVIIGQCTANGVISLRPKRPIVTLNLHRSVVVRNNQGVASKYAGIGMRV